MPQAERRPTSSGAASRQGRARAGGPGRLRPLREHAAGLPPEL